MEQIILLSNTTFLPNSGKKINNINLILTNKKYILIINNIKVVYILQLKFLTKPYTFFQPNIMLL